MRNRTHFFSQSMILLILTGFLFSWTTLSRAGSESGGNKPSDTGPSMGRVSYMQYAALIAGIHIPGSTLAAFEKSPGWREFAATADKNWGKYEKNQLAQMRQWASSELASPISSGLTVLYPFSGADFINPYTLFPHAGTYVLMALEPVGEVHDFQDMSGKDFDEFFVDLQYSLHDLLSVDYFISAHMHAVMGSKDLKGVLPILLFIMAREKARVIDVDYWFMEPDGTIRNVPALGKDQPASDGAVPGIRIVFESASSPADKPQTLYYFRLNLLNPTFRRNSHFIAFLKGLGPLITFMKSASFVMFDPQASIVRQFVLDQSRFILQEDSGIPYKYFDPAVWALQFYGTYKEPIPIFKHHIQADLAAVYGTAKDLKPLPFGMGYHYQAGTANLMLAKKKK